MRTLTTVTMVGAITLAAVAPALAQQANPCAPPSQKAQNPCAAKTPASQTAQSPAAVQTPTAKNPCAAKHPAASPETSRSFRHSIDRDSQRP